MEQKTKKPHQRLFEQKTINSFIRCSSDKRNSLDSLDLSLSSVYNHETNLFASKFKTVLQLENSEFNPFEKQVFDEANKKCKKYLHHPLVIGKLLHEKYIAQEETEN